MDLKDKKCKKCGSGDLFKQKREAEQEDDVRCMLCGLVAPPEQFEVSDDEKKDKQFFYF